MANKISRKEYDEAKKVVSAYTKQQIKNKSKEYYGKAKAKTKKGARSFGQYIKKVLTTK